LKKRRASRSLLGLRYFGPVVDHEFMGPIGIATDIGRRPIVGISKMEFFADLNVNEGNEGIPASPGNACTHQIIKYEAGIDIHAQGLTVLGPD